MKTSKEILKGSTIKKEKRVMLRFHRDYKGPLKKKFVKYDIKGFQELFDHLFVSGVVFRNPFVLDFIEDNIQELQEESRKERLSRFDKSKPSSKKTKNMYGFNAYMYSEDYVALKHYLLDKGYKQAWLCKILFIDGFLKEVPEIIELIKENKENNVNKRKKAVARLSNDKFVSRLSPRDAKNILKKMTERYDSRKFGDKIQQYINEIVVEDKMEDQDDEDLDLEFSRKIENLKRQKEQEIEKITENPNYLEVE